MARRFVDKKTHRFYFLNDQQKRKSYVLTFGDEVNTLTGNAPSGVKFKRTNSAHACSIGSIR